MRRVLILGGTAWLGRAIARAAIDPETEVVCLARGESGVTPEGVRFVRADRTVPRAYEHVSGHWDEVVELAYEPELVESALVALADRAQHWTLVSSVSAYANNDEPGADESANLVEPQDLSAYADAKVAAERATASRLGDRLLIARPGLIVGPGDPSDRFGYWPARLLRGGRVLAPEPAGRFVQVIDVADLATWIVHAGRADVTGAINAVGHPHSFETFLDMAGEVAGFDGEFVSADDEWLLERDVRYWAGTRSLPLWLPVSDAAFAQRSNAAYLATGGLIRPLPESLERSRDDEIARGAQRERRSGLTPEDEFDLVAARARHSAPL
jgi:2'-hydroxyisoflavone reductase